MKKAFTYLFVSLLIISFILGLSACGKVEFKLNFVVDGEVYATVSTSGEELIEIPENPTKDGFTFDGWYLDKDVWCEHFEANSLLNAPISSDMSVYAKWNANYIKEELQLTLQENTNTYAVTGYTGTDSVVVIPSQYGGLDVTVIDAQAFSGNTIITAVTIPDSVISIGDSAFSACSSLTDVTIPAGVTSIGDSAFRDCTSLTGVNLPESATSIGYSVFRGCSSLTDVTIPTGVTSIGDYAFSACSSLRGITIPDGVTSIGDSAFRDSAGLASITIPDSIASIGENAFLGCYGLKEVCISDIAAWCNIVFNNSSSNPLFYVDNLLLDGAPVTDPTIPDSVTKIGNYAFYGYKSLTSVTIPDSVTSIGSVAFRGCSSLTSITIPVGVTSIGNYVFYDCSSLASVTIPDGVTSIGSYAFYDCRSLASITIPDSVTSIGDDAFDGCYKLVEVIDNSGLNISKGSGHGKVAYYAIEVHTGDSKIINYNDYLFYTTHSGINYLFGYVGNETNLTLPNSYNNQSYEIYDYAFYDCQSLTSITIPDSVTCIGDRAFYGCSSLTSVTIPGSVTDIGAYAFRGNASLTSVVIENGVGGIANNAFRDCSELASVTIPASISFIGVSAFEGCYKLVEVINKSNLRFTLGSNAYGYVAYYAIEVHTGDSKVVNYNDYLFYTTYSGINYLFGYVGNDTELVFPDSYNNQSYEIYDYAFYNCRSLRSIIIPDAVTKIGSYAFYGCLKLTDITFSGTGAWYRTRYSQYIDGTITSVINPSDNVTYFTRTYYDYYWYKE